MSNDNEQRDSALPRHSESQPGASVLIKSSGEGEMTISFSDGSDALTMNRRDFMRVSGVAAATAAMSSAACREPQREITPYVDRPEEVRIGNTRQYASTCQACPAECGIRIKTRAGRPIKLEGNDRHPVSKGGLCGRGQASYMDLYDPDRLEGPVRVDGETTEPIEWDELDEQVRQAVDGASVRLLTGGRTGPATRGLIDEIADEAGDVDHYVYEPMSDQAVEAASEAGYGEPGVPTYHFERADLIVSFGADFLGTWLSPVGFTDEFASGRDFFEQEQQFEQSDADEFDPEMNRLVTFEPTMTTTGTSADDRWAVHPEHLAAVAMCLARELFENHDPQGLDAADVDQTLEPFDPQSIADLLGEHVDADDLRDIAAELADHQGNSIVVGAGASTPENGVALESAVNLLNAALGNDGETVDRARPSRQSPGGEDQLRALIDEIEAGDVDVLIVDDTNPVYASPAGLDVASALEDVDLVVSTADRVDETSRLADLVAAGTHYLEAWGDAQPRDGVYSLQQPAILPLYDNRAFEDSLLEWFGPESDRLADLLEPPEPPPETSRERGGERDDDKPYDAGPFYRYLRDFWRRELFDRSDSVATFDQFWLEARQTGVYEADVDDPPTPSLDVDATTDLLVDDLPDVDDVDAGDLGGKVLHLFRSVPMYDGRQANNGHLQEMPEPITKHTWGSYAMVGYRTFQAADLESGQVLEFETEDGQTLQFPVICIPGLHEDVIALPVGYGRTEVGGVGDQVGENAFRLADVDEDGVYFSGISAEVRATDRTVELPVTQHGDVLDVDYRRILATASLDEYAQDQNAGVYHTPIDYTLWPEHEFGPVKWGMAIDLSKCTGCSACVIACQEENNIPVVGRQGVIEGREMHWLRLDRYYRLPEDGVEAREGLLDDPMYDEEPLVAFGEYLDDQPRVINQPMLCQHCDKAPCESVCPVVATMQSEDGLNQMAYNRCVGTRYCSNNCPYKVRRFNWFNYAENREDSIFARMYPELEEHGRLNQESPLEMAFNPDVTVRERGVMEKCTFCVQRIRRGKWEVAKEGRRTFEDGEVVTACQESCPANAIEFGDLLDDDHKVSKMHHRNRAMYALSDLKTEPALAYMTDVYNTDEQLT